MEKVLSKLSIINPSWEYEHEFLMFEDKDSLAERIKYIVDNEDEFPSLTLGVGNSHFIYPMDFLKTQCYIRIDGMELDETETTKSECGKIISISKRKSGD